MRHLHVSLSASMHRFVLLLFILGSVQSIYAESTFQFPDFNRRLPERPTSPGCAYKGAHYEHGERVSTDEPCLNCTCTRVVLVCYLRVCPTSSAPPPGCFAAREPGECCPTFICGGADLSKPKNNSDSNIDLRPTFQPIGEETTANDFSTVDDHGRYTSVSVFKNPVETNDFEEDKKTVAVDTTLDSTSSYPPVYEGHIDITGSTEDTKTVATSTARENISSYPPAYESQTDTTESAENIKTISTSTTQDKISSHYPTYDDHTDITISAVGVKTVTASTADKTASISHQAHDGHADTTLPAEGIKTVATSTIPENLSEDTETFDDTPTYEVTSSVYDNAFHTSLHDDDSLVYISSTRDPTFDYDTTFFGDVSGGCMVNGTLYGDGSAMLSSSFCQYCFCIRGKSTCLKPKCHLAIEGCVPLYDTHYSCCPSRYDCSQRTTQNTKSVDTTVISTSLPSTTVAGNPSDCIVDGITYHQGELIPDHETCHNCYCSDSSVVCEKIKCSPPIDGCRPIIPQGHCCPISYRCDYQTGGAENSVKGSILDDNVTSPENKGEIKTVKNYYYNDDISLKTNEHRKGSIHLTNDNTLRRLDENPNFQINSTMINTQESSPAYTGHGVFTTIYDEEDGTSDHIRENDKTLNIELNGTTQTTLDAYGEELFREILQTLSQTTAFQDDPSSTEAVLVGSPEVHTLSIQELFDKFFSRHNVNASKLPGEISTEPKRNNSKQPSSIVEIYDAEPDSPDSTTTITTVITKSSATDENETLNNVTGSQDTNFVTSGYTDPITEKVSTTEQTEDNIHVTNYEQGSSFYDEKKTENEAISTISQNTETQNVEEFHTRNDNEPTYPVFTTRNNDFDEGFSIHPTLTAFTSGEDLTDHDILEATLSQIFNTASEIYTNKFRTQDETQPTSPDTSTKHIYGETSQETHPTSPDYKTTKHSLIEGLKMHTETRPVVFIYDSTRKFHTGAPTLPSQTLTSTVPLEDTTKNSFDDEEKTTYETYSPSFVFDTAENSFSDQFLTESSSAEFTRPKDNDELKKQSDIHPTTSIHTTNINVEDQTTSSINTNSDHSEQTKVETVSQHMSTTPNYSGNSEKEQHTQTYFESTYQTKLTTNKDANTGDFAKETEIHTSPVFTSTRYLDISQSETKADTNPTKKTSVTPEISTKKLNKVAQAVTQAFLPTKVDEENHEESHLTTINIPLSTTTTLKDPITTESTKLSTRINSKLPSFNYVQKTNEKNNTSFYPQNPVLTDSVVNVYLPEDQDSVPGEGSNFTNVGSVYIGAPLSVGETDSRKGVGIGKTKITQSGGVIFMDPKYTDINTKNNFPYRKIVKGAGSSSNRNRGSTVKQPSSIPNPETFEKDPGNNEKKKGPRIQDAYNQSSANQGYKIIPFVAEDAVRGQFGKINNTLVVQQGSTEGLPDIVSDFCFIKGRIYMNGEMIGKPDPCELCRCFYGRELCQIQRCPTPPDCIPEKVPGFCCPRFTCGNNATSNAQVNKEKEAKPINFVQLAEIVVPTSTRKPESIERIPPTDDKQEVKFGIRVRARPTPNPPIKSTGYTTEKRILLTTTIKPEIRTLLSRTSPSTTTTTTSKRPNVVRPITNIKPEMKRTTTTTTTTTTQSPLFPDPWGLLKVSGCNIYGKYFNINDQVEILSGPCSHCICTTNGVECNDIC